MISNRHFVYVDSHNKLASQDTDASFSYAISFPDDTSYDSVAVLNALIPKSYYLVPSGLNTFTLKELGVSTTITIPIGCYTITGFMNVIIPLLNTASTLLGHNWVYTVTLPGTTTTQTGKLTFNVTGNGLNQPSFIMLGTNNIFKLFGFNKNTTNTFVGNNITSINVVKFQVEDRLFINSDMVKGTTNVSNSILQEINVQASPDFSTIIYDNICPEYYSKPLLGKKNIYNFWFTNEDGQ